MVSGIWNINGILITCKTSIAAIFATTVTAKHSAEYLPEKTNNVITWVKIIAGTYMELCNHPFRVTK